MAVLTVNAGSSTLKLRLVGPDDAVLGAVDLDPWDGRTVPGAADLLAGADAVGHRVVHGGTDLVGPTPVDDAVLARIEALTPLAPLHQPRSVAAIRAVRSLHPAIPAVACFDTAFHATLPAAAATYALPAAWRERWPLRRFGFHGLSHQYAVRRAAELTGPVPGGLRVVSCHLGAGASLCASVGGRSVDTTMGFTPLEGLVMATRSGSVDPGLVLWLQTEGGLSAAEVRHGLERESGLAGLSGTSGDLRELGRGDTRLAVDVYVHRLRREVAAMAAATGGLDVLVFTGGVGEHQPAVRAAATRGMGFLGVAVDEAANAITSSDAEITAAGAPVRTLVVVSREDLEMARQVRATLTPAS
ncbi:MAG: acetate/propionate family kinase [Actinomycetota bacterium]|nr:acetate/propionate family kinase [Actinomycetota bacterium]